MSVAQLGKYPSDSGSNISVYTDTLTPISSATIAGLSGLTGMMVYNSSLGSPQYFNGTSWLTIPNGGTGSSSQSNRSVIQTTAAGIWTIPSVNVQVDAARDSNGVCTLTVTAATGFTGETSILGPTGNGSAVATIDISALPAAFYEVQNNNPPTRNIECIVAGSIEAQDAYARMDTTHLQQLDITFPTITSGSSNGFAQFDYVYFGVPHS